MKTNRKASLSIAKWISVFTISAAMLIIFGNGTPLSERAVIINSDDAGMCSSVNLGTITALEYGLIRSTSIMVCCPAFEEFAAYARNHPEYDFGVHLTLTCDLRSAGWGPVSPSNKVPSLVDKDGFFHEYTEMVVESADIREVELELRAQIAKAHNAGIRITHFDNHMFVLDARPDLLRLYVDLGIEFKLPIRFAREVPSRYLTLYGKTYTDIHATLINKMENAGLPFLDRIESSNYSIAPAEKRGFFLNDLRTLQPGVVEIVIHCAAPDDSGIEPPDAAARYADTVCFSSREILDEIRSVRAKRIDWGSLRDWKASISLR